MLKSLRAFKEMHFQGKGEGLLKPEVQRDINKWSDLYLQYLKSERVAFDCVKDQVKFLAPKLWSQIHGVEMTRILANKYGVIGGDGIPQESEALLPIGVRYEGRKEKLLLGGQLIDPSITKVAPSILFEKVEDGKDYFVAVSDMDNVSEGKKRPILLYYGEERRTILPYIPPHPARGTGVHRIVVAVGTVEKNFTLNQRKCTIPEMLQETNGKILGVSFFRTFWTKHVTEFYGQLGKREPVYGEVEAAYKGPAINTLFL